MNSLGHFGTLSAFSERERERERKMREKESERARDGESVKTS